MKKKNEDVFDIGEFDSDFSFPDFSDSGSPELTPVQKQLSEEVSGNTLEERAHNQVSALVQGFRDARKESERKVKNALDSEYWFCVCFKNREQKDLLLSALKLTSIGDKYLDGEKVAKAMGVKLPPVNLFERKPAEVKKLHGVEVI